MSLHGVVRLIFGAQTNAMLPAYHHSQQSNHSYDIILDMKRNERNPHSYRHLYDISNQIYRVRNACARRALVTRVDGSKFG